ncbi:hypothetical protein BEP19_06175 [Ammoniphilus oxalaticus]|uniref:Uncharacterized protein n=1 Tax=Ammoniphilus oxalaticus TaxID=66863 RepID=A0A419SJ71_9BACL|nr:hypothetical protein [Ammoniphilus oxalaticus]RKD24002.1 hypothetical protein BEP19_06175 [Ammoniphilus oxalaticus]
MIFGWILDLIFSNLWLILILYWVFTSISKAGKKTGEAAERMPKETPMFPNNDPSVWEVDIEEPRYAVPAEPMTRSTVVPQKTNRTAAPSARETKGAPQDRAHPVATGKSARSQSEEQGSVPLAEPAQGMIWSQVFGPPRSKQPHRPFRRS